MTLPQEIAEQITDTNQNRNAVKCKDCGSLILNPTMASFEQRSVSYSFKLSPAFFNVYYLFVVLLIGGSSKSSSKKYSECQ